LPASVKIFFTENRKQKTENHARHTHKTGGHYGKPNMAGLVAARLLILVSLISLVSLLWSGPAAADRQKKQEQVVTEYLLEQAGFDKWRVTYDMPKREALLSALPKGTIVTYRADGKVYHTYGDHTARIIYVGDEAAYQRYLSLAEKKNLCERREGGESPPSGPASMRCGRGAGGKRGNRGAAAVAGRFPLISRPCRGRHMGAGLCLAAGAHDSRAWPVQREKVWWHRQTCALAQVRTPVPPGFSKVGGVSPSWPARRPITGRTGFQPVRAQVETR
jgi:hypothetical protein